MLSLKNDCGAGLRGGGSKGCMGRAFFWIWVGAVFLGELHSPAGRFFLEGTRGGRELRIFFESRRVACFYG